MAQSHRYRQAGLTRTKAGPAVRGCIVVAGRAGAQKATLLPEGLSAADFAALPARDGFTIVDPSAAMDAAARFG